MHVIDQMIVSKFDNVIQPINQIIIASLLLKVTNPWNELCFL